MRRARKVFTTIDRKRFIDEGILLNRNREDEYYQSEEAVELLNERARTRYNEQGEG